MKTIRWLPVLVIVLLMALEAGCGSGSSPRGAAGVGRAIFTIQWTQKAQPAPAASNSIKITLNQGTTPLASSLLTRPATSTAFDNLPARTLTANAAAYPSSDGSGVAQAQASVTLAIVAGQTTTLPLALESTIDHLDVTPPTPCVPPGRTMTLTVTARDRAGNVVLVKSGTLQWVSSNATVAAVDSSGNVTGVTAGLATIQCIETESKKSGSAVVYTSPNIHTDDPNWFFSPYNWCRIDAQYAETTHTGAYCKLTFSGTNAGLALDLSPLAGVPVSSWPMIRWQIDQDPPQNHLLVPQDAHLPLNAAPLTAGQHTLTVWVVGNDLSQDRWVQPVEVARITGLFVDGSSSASPLLPKRILFYGDSLSEGEFTEKLSSAWHDDNDSTHAYTYTCAAALNAEFGVVGFCGQGWVVSNASSSNHVPPLTATWNCQSNGVPRVFLPAPDYVVAMEGANDTFAGIAPDRVRDAVETWLGKARAALPASKIFLVVEFGGYDRDALTQAINAYCAPTGDTNTYLIDLGPSADTGLGGHVSGGTAQSYDGVHPNAATSQALGTRLGQAIQVMVERRHE